MRQISPTPIRCKMFFGLVMQFFVCYGSVALAEGSSDQKQLFAMTGVTTNNVEHGITQSQQSWSLMSSFGYNLGQIAKLGIDGDSVEFPDAAENLNLRFFFGVKFDISPVNVLLIRYDFNQYFQSGSRDGNIISLKDKFMGYHVGIEQNSNWEGLSRSATWFGLGKEIDLGAGILADTEVGYTQQSVTGFKNYFDLMASLGTAVSDIFVKVSATTTSQSSQFAGRGGSFLFFTATVTFH